MSNPKIAPQPRTAMEAAFNKAVQRRATEKPKRQPPEVIEQCAECAAYDPDATCPQCRFLEDKS